ncbi:MAG: hypothetical protein ACRCYE_04850 [Sarcina sp.]
MKLSDRDVLDKITDALETNNKLTLAQDKLLLQYLKKGKYKDYSIEDRKLIEKYVKLSDFLAFREQYETLKKKHDKITLFMAVIILILFTVSSYIPKGSAIEYALIAVIIVLLILCGIKIYFFRKTINELYAVHNKIWLENVK